MPSLTARLLLAVGALLLLFFGLTIYVLDTSFRSAAEEAVLERLDVQTLALLAAADPSDSGGLSFPDPLPESRFESPASGLYGTLLEVDSGRVWRSPSMVGTAIAFPESVPAGERVFERIDTADGTRVFALSSGIVWQLNDAADLRLVVSVAESPAAYNAQVGRFRRQLFGWFAGLMILMIAAQGVLLGWVLSPLRRAESEVRAIEQGRLTALGDDYPRELAGLTRHTNILLDTERARVARYRDTLGNLAHSIKTPLSVIRHAAGEGPGEDAAVIEEQVGRIQKILDYQLKRAAASGGHLSIRAINVSEAIGDILETLQKVHRRPELRIERQVDPELDFLGDRGDLLEILGNVIDNAFKWAASVIRIEASLSDERIGHGRAFRLVVEDDGPGIAADRRAFVLRRGARADESSPGHGIGLSVVRETVVLQGGTLDIGNSDLGGARIVMGLPAR